MKTTTQNNRTIKAASIISILVFFFVLINVNSTSAQSINKISKHNVTISIQKNISTDTNTIETKTTSTNNTDNSVSSRIKRSNGQAIWVKGIQVLVFKYIPLAA